MLITVSHEQLVLLRGHDFTWQGTQKCVTIGMMGSERYLDQVGRWHSPGPSAKHSHLPQ